METRESNVSASKETILHISSEMPHSNTTDSENLTFFNDLDEYMSEIKSRLAVSKLVSNSILKGVVTAIEQEASEKNSKVHNSLDSSTIAIFENITMKQFQKVKQEINKSNHHKDSPNLTKATEELSHILHTLFKQAKETKTHEESHLQTHIENRVTSICLKETKPFNENHTLQKIAALKDEIEELSKSFSESENFFTFSDNQNEPNSHVALKALRWEENGKSDPSVITMPENLDLSQLKHFTKDELGNYLKLEMMKLKRHFEQKIHEMTEEIFALKRDYSKGRTSWKIQTHEHQKVPEIIQSIREILKEIGNSVALNSVKMSMSNVLAENHHLKEMLAEKERNIHCLSSKLSDATENLSKQFVAELKLKRMLNDVKKEKHDVYTEAFVTNDLFVFLLKEALSDATFFGQKSRLKVEKIKEKADDLCGRMDDLEDLALRNMRKNCLRLESLRGSFGGGHVVKILKGKLERKACDLEKAEAEVDLLGDEVDALLSLLEKIYIALDHYSPVLVHYPGIIDILKLIRRELCGANPKHF